jgi:hypothetical protein
MGLRIALMTFLSIGLISFSGHCLSQVAGEWTFLSFPESMISNIVVADGHVYLTINSEHDYEDTLKYEYATRILRVDMSTNDFTDFEELFVENTGRRRHSSVRLNKFRDSWILSRGFYNPYGVDTFYVSELNENFEYQNTILKPTDDTPLNILTTISVDSIGYFGIGSFVALGDSLLSVRIDNEAHQPAIQRFRYSPILPFITSIDYDAIRRKFLIFNYLGIAELNDTLGLLKVYYVNAVHTATHGSLIARGSNYYTFGCTPFNISVENRDLVFHKYDTSLQIEFRDTFGRDGKDDYPFIFNALFPARWAASCARPSPPTRWPVAWWAR